LLGIQKNTQLHTLSRQKLLEDQQLEEATNPATKHQRHWVDVEVVRDILKLRYGDRWEPVKIEKHFGLAAGVVERLGTYVKNA
jgi:hypothetical protein